MEEKNQLQSEANEAESAPTHVDTAPVSTEKPKRNLRLILAIVAVVLCACLTIGAVIIVTGINRASSEKAPVEFVLDSFMEAMLVRDIDGAYELFSPRAQRQFSEATIEGLVEGSNYVLYEGYQSLTVQNINIKLVTNTNPDLPQGTVAEVSGVISYEGDFTGQFEATLEKDDDSWLLHYFNVTVPPDKVRP